MFSCMLVRVTCTPSPMQPHSPTPQAATSCLTDALLSFLCLHVFTLKLLRFWGCTSPEAEELKCKNMQAQKTKQCVGKTACRCLWCRAVGLHRRRRARHPHQHTREH